MSENPEEMLAAKQPDLQVASVAGSKRDGPRSFATEKSAWEPYPPQNLAAFSAIQVVLLSVVYAALFGLESVCVGRTWLGVWLYGALEVVAVIVLVTALRLDPRGTNRSSEQERVQSWTSRGGSYRSTSRKSSRAQSGITVPTLIFSGVIAGVVVFLVAFSELCRYLFEALGGFSASQTGYWHWLRLSLSWTLDNGLFNASQVYGWNITEIRATALWSETLTVAFNVVLELVAVASFIRVGQYAIERWRQAWDRASVASGANEHGIGDVLAHSYIAKVLYRTGGIMVSAVWVVPTLVFADAAFNDGLSVPGAVSSVVTVAPVVFGIWLASQGLVGIVLESKTFNKLQAILLFIAGIVALAVTQPAALVQFNL